MAGHDVHLAQMNIGRMSGPIDSPVMSEFVARLPEINALAVSFALRPFARGRREA